MVFKNRKSNRLKKYDYSDSGRYFVTICTQNKECLFGDIVNNKIILNQNGLLINKKGLINQTPTLGLIIRYFKSKCTYELHKNGFDNDLWQRNYYENIIRNERSLFQIRQYISDNPTNWKEDRNNSFNQQPNGN